MGSKKGRKPFNIHMCEIVYTAIVMSLQKHEGIYKTTRDAINHFIKNSETFKNLQEGKLYDDFINGCLKNSPDKLLDYKEYNEKISKDKADQFDGQKIIHEYTETRFGGKDKPKGFPQLHDLEEIKKEMEEMDYDYYEPETGEPITKEQIEELRKDRDRIKLEIARVADPDERSDKTSTGFSDRAYKQIWRMCQTYEDYCIETNQTGPLPLNIIRQDQDYKPH